jgi:mRNA interferase MazF
VLVCLLTTTLRDAPFYRLSLPAGEATEATGLRETSQVMVDKIMAVRRDRCGTPIGRADDAALLALGRRLAFVVGTAD